MTVASLCSREIASLDRSETLPLAARLMREQHVGTVVVTEERGDGVHVVGIVTDRDLAIEGLARGAAACTMQVGMLLSGGPLVSVAEQADIGEAIALMQGSGVRRLLVRDAEGHLVGVISFDDLLRVCGAQLAALAQVPGRGRQHEADAARDLPPLTPLTTPSAPAAGAAPPRPRLRVPAMGTAGWSMPTRLAPGRPGEP
ncbi:MAG: CBS domain-containing protein [Rubrivivax sp.]|nr:CBS domain-containing protein [Rubrivivax sp.]